MENGGWRMEDGEWRMENGRWRIENRLIVNRLKSYNLNKIPS
jgi:hypothetical protein